jgi:hypothetical protein
MDLNKLNDKEFRNKLLVYLYCFICFASGLIIGIGYFKIQLESIENVLKPCINFCVSSPNFNESLKIYLTGTNINYSNINYSNIKEVKNDY